MSKILIDYIDEAFEECGTLLVDAAPFVKFNVEEGGYLEYEDDEFCDAFARYADCNFIEVDEAEDTGEWYLRDGEPYTFAVPYGAVIEYEPYD